MAHQLLLNMFGAHQPHVDNQGLLGHGELLPVGLLALFLAVARDEDGTLGVVAVGKRDTGISGGASGGRDAGHHGEGDPLCRQHLQLLAATAKHEGITALEAHHTVTRPGVFHQEAVGLFLGHAVGTGLLADRDQGGITAHQIQDLRRDQLVIEHHFRLLDLLQRLEGQQTRIARARTDQHHLAHLALGLVEPVIEPGFGTLPILLFDKPCQGVGGKCPLPEAATIRNG